MPKIILYVRGRDPYHIWLTRWGLTPKKDIQNKSTAFIYAPQNLILHRQSCFYYWSFVWKTLLGASPKPHHDLHFVVLCVICQFTQFTCVNQWFTHKQRLSLHSRSLESYKADYMCKCDWIDIASARASAIEVYTCKLVVYTCKLAISTQAKTVLTFQIIEIIQGRLHV